MSSCNCNNPWHDEWCPSFLPPAEVCPDGEACEEQVSTDCVIYTGPDIPCYGVTTGMTITQVLDILYHALYPNCLTTTTSSTSTTTTTSGGPTTTSTTSGLTTTTTTTPIATTSTTTSTTSTTTLEPSTTTTSTTSTTSTSTTTTTEEPTTTTTAEPTTTTSSTTTTEEPTTTTTTTAIVCDQWTNLSGVDAFYDWTDCDNVEHLNEAIPNDISICVKNGILAYISGGILTESGSC